MGKNFNRYFTKDIEKANTKMKNCSISLTTLKRSMVGFYKFKHITYEPAIPFIGIYSVQFSRSVVSDSLCLPRLQHARLPCPSPTPEFTQTHAHWVGDAIQPSHPLLSPSPPTFNLSQHQGLFKWVNSSHQVAKVLEFQLQHQSFQWTPRTDFL